MTPLVAFNALIPGVIPDLAAPDAPPAIAPDAIAMAVEAHPRPSPEAMAYAKRHVTLTGHIEVPLVMQWNAFDQTVPARFHAVYPAQIRAAGRGKWPAVLDPVNDGHYDFTDEQTSTAFDTLLRKAGAD